MKSNYEKYMEETWEVKETAYKDFKASGFRNYADFVKADLKGIKIKYHGKKKAAA